MSQNEQKNGSVFRVDLRRVKPYYEQPRQEFDDERTAALADSMQEHGQLTPCLVRPAGDGSSFVLLDGERRWRAAQLNGWQTIEVFVRRNIGDDDEAFVSAVVANCSREDLSPSETASAVKRVWSMPRYAELSPAARQEVVGKMFGRSSTWVENYVALNELPPEVVKLVDGEEGKKLPVKAALELRALPDRSLQQKIGERVAVAKLGSEPARKAVREAIAAERVTPHTPLQSPGLKAHNDARLFRTLIAQVHTAVETALELAADRVASALTIAPGIRGEIEIMLDRSIESLTTMRDAIKKVKR